MVGHAEAVLRNDHACKNSSRRRHRRLFGGRFVSIETETNWKIVGEAENGKIAVGMDSRSSVRTSFSWIFQCPS